MNKNVVRAGVVVAGLLAFVSCAPKSVKVSNTPSAAPAAGLDATEASLRGGGFTAIPELTVVHFDYDSAQLSAEARRTLRANASYLRDHPDLDVLAAGNCDQRGTVEYNLALGQRRARAVRNYYAHLGIHRHRIATISYGKEKPLCSEMTESCWSQNRRTETLARAKVADHQQPAAPAQ